MKFKPCGCLTDGYNWLKECNEHIRIRRDRLTAMQALRDLLAYVDDQPRLRPHQAPRIAAQLLKKWGL
jgi:hypothetical protein